MPAITKATIKAAQPRAERYMIWDSRTPGLGLRVMPSGVVSWVYNHRLPDGTKRMHTLGRVDLFHPDVAREEANKIAASLKTGKDPVAVIRAKRHMPTVAEMCDQFAAVHFPLVKAGTVKNYSSIFKIHIKPRFGDRRVDQVTKADIRDWKGESMTKQVIFNKSRDLLAQVMDYAVERDIIAANPVRNHRLKNFPEQGRKRFLTLAEAPRFAQAMLEYGRDSDTRWRFTALMTLLLLTGCRLSEILQARWEWVNWEEKRIDWPDTKTGADEAHLAPPVLELLRELQRRVPGNPFIIAGAHIGKPLGGHNNMWRAVCAAAGIKNLRIHDLRKSFASIALADGVGIDVIAGLLRHSNPAITAERYAFLMDEERKAAADKVATAVTRRLRLVA